MPLQDVRGPVPRCGTNVVDLTGQLSNPQPALEALAELEIGVPECAPPRKALAPDRLRRTDSRTLLRLKPAEVAALVTAYMAGTSMRNLAAEFGIERRTVSAHLRRAQVPIRRGGLDPNRAVEAARLYAEGWSCGRLADRFEVSPNSVLRTLRAANVAIRPRRGGPVSSRRPTS